MSEEAYRLRTTLRHHTADVRAVSSCRTDRDLLVSGSRDCTAQLWSDDGIGSSFTSAPVPYRGHTGYVSSVIIIPPSSRFPSGLVLTGGHDCVINVFDLDNSTPIRILHGHGGAVSSLAFREDQGLVSGSWDCSFIVWNEDLSDLKYAVPAHDAAVWAVTLLPSRAGLLTASADKTIKLWAIDRLQNTYIGHTDCVRGLATLSNDQFLSCANDSTVRRWALSGECLAVVGGHTGYIYGIALLSGGEFVTCSEDRSVRIWKETVCIQVLVVPAQSAWSVTVLSSGDIAVGCSDHNVHVFTKNPARFADEKALSVYNAALSSQSIPAPTSGIEEADSIDPETLPGMEALSTPGTKNGQVVMVRGRFMPEVYLWDSALSQWIKVGDLSGSSTKDGKSAIGGKVMYEGKEYDYVFSIDVAEGQPHLKLPYNMGDDPWLVAHSFIEKNLLPREYLDQVADFIIKNTGTVTLGEKSIRQDPFTGSNRYVPQMAQSKTGRSSPFDLSNYCTAIQANVPAIFTKLQSFLRDTTIEIQIESSSLSLLEKEVQASLTGNHAPSADTLNTVQTLLRKLLRLGKTHMFPVLDIIRLLAMSKPYAEMTLSSELLEQLLGLVSEPGKPLASSLMLLRLVVNLFQHDLTRSEIRRRFDFIVTCCVEALLSSNPNLQLAASQTFLNYAISFSAESASLKIRLVEHVVNALLITGMPSNVRHNLVLSLGKLAVGDAETTNFVRSLGIKDTPLVSESDGAAIVDIVSDLKKLL